MKPIGGSSNDGDLAIHESDSTVKPEPEYEPDPNVNTKNLVITEDLGKKIVVANQTEPDQTLAVLIRSTDGIDVVMNISADDCNRLYTHLGNAYNRWRV